jgi:hypothetical protein
MSTSLKNQIIKLNLLKIKKILKKRGFTFVKRKENQDTLQQLDITTYDVGNAIFKLTVSDYQKGPEEDLDGSDGNIWAFIHPVLGCKVYIKVKVYKVNEEEYLKVISFHEPRG